jgi:hypothetical protein
MAGPVDDILKGFGRLIHLGINSANVIERYGR